MILTRTALRRKLAEAWERGYQAGYGDGDTDAEWSRNDTLGYVLGPEPVAAVNPRAPWSERWSPHHK